MTATKTRAKAKSAAKKTPKKATTAKPKTPAKKTAKKTAKSSRSVDPRLQARRRSVERRAGWRRLRVVAAITLLASAVVGGIAVANSSWLDIERVTVVGAARANPNQIVTSSGVVVGEPLIDIDPDASAAAIERVPWVATASVDRSWTGDVVIEVTERTPLAALPTDARYALVDATGHELELVEQRPDGYLPTVGVQARGVPGETVDADARAVVALAAALTPAVEAASSEIGLVDGELTINLAAGGRATLGDQRELGDKLVALETILTRVDLACLAVIDVAVPSAPTVRRIGLDSGQTVPESEGAEC